MSTPNRAALIAKLHKVLKKHYQPIELPPNRPVLEQMMLACCLENATFATAEMAIKALSTSFFDWNEVRVSTIKELSEVVSMLPDPQAAAVRLRGVLQGVFESTYSFDIDQLRKMNQGQAIKKIEKLPGMSAFGLAFTTQTALAGHAIALDRSALEVLWIVGVVSDAEKAKRIAPGLERAIPKSKGSEFFTLLHQFGADLAANQFSTNLHKLLLEISSDAKHRLPRRLTKKQIEAQQAAEKAARAAAAAAREAAAKAAAEKQAKADAAKAGKTADGKGGKPAPGKDAKTAPAKDAKSTAKPVAKPAPVEAKKKPVEAAGKHAKPEPAKKPAAPPAKPALPQAKSAKKSPAAALGKRKPR